MNKIKSRFKIVLTFLALAMLISFIPGRLVRSVDNKPEIQAILKSVTPNPASAENDIEVTYTIQPNEFQSSQNNEDKDIVLIIDTTTDDKGNQFSKKLKEALEQQIINESFINSTNKVRLSIIAFNGSNNDKESIVKEVGLTSNVTLLKDGLSKISYTGDNVGNISQAIVRADEILSQSQSGSKSIIIAGFGEISYGGISTEDIKSKKYNVFGVNFESSQSLKELYLLLGGDTTEKYGQYIDFIVTNNSGASHIDNGIAFIKDRLKSKLIESYIFKDIVLNFDLGENFEPAQNSNLVLNSGSKYSVSVPQIIYTGEQTSQGSGSYTYRVSSEYLPMEVKFKMKSKVGKTGQLDFENYQDINITNIKYTGISGNSIKNSIETPSVFIYDDIPNIKANLISNETVTTTLGNEVELKYEITPEEFEYPVNTDNLGEKEIVVILDNSKRMEKGINTIKGNAFWNDFLSVLDNKKARYGLITFSDQINSDGNNIVVKQELSQFVSATDFNNNIVKNININGNLEAIDINIDLAIKEANRMLNEGNSSASKHIFIISGGDVVYSEDMIKEASNKNYNIISLAYSKEENNDNPYSTFKILHEKLNGVNEGYFVAKYDSGNYNDLQNNQMKEIVKRIDDRYYRSYSFSPSLVLDLNNNFSVGTGITETDNDKAIINLPNIEYRLEGDKHVAKSFEVSFKVVPNKVGILEFGDKNIISYTGFDDKILNNIITTPIVTVMEQGESPSVQIKASDSSGGVPDIYDSTKNNSHYNVDNNGEVYKLYGKSNVEINFSGKDITHLRYKFVKEDTDTNDAEWRYISAEGDVNTQKPGYLTQMPYDVSHMDLLSNNEKWSNRQEVFKTKFESETAPISMEVSPAHSHGDNCKSDANHYVTSKTMTNESRQTVTRWVPKTLFVQNHNVGSYANGYKEASKTWGYIKVPVSGEYWFQTWADDGFYGAITVDGEAKVFGDDFRPRGSSAINAKESIYLEANKYYPIYLEYFNWGGSADYRIMYSVGDKNNYRLVDKNWFYPSNSDSPTDNSNSIFMGGSIVDFETEPGIYTIQYEVGKLEGEVFTNTSVGSFGKFEVEERFELEKRLSVTNIDKDEEFEIVYEVTPKPIKLTDLYKVTANDIESISNIPATLTVENIELRDTVSNGISLIGSNSTNIYSIKDKIEYRRSEDQFIADEYKFVIRVKATSNDVSFDNETGEIHYRDISLVDNLRISQKQVFSDKPELGVYDKSIIIKHGLFLNKSIEQGNVKVSSDMPYTFGFVIDAKGVNNGFTIEIPSDVEIDKSSATIYELDKDEKIISSIKETINGENISDSKISYENSSGFIKNGKKYAVVYKVKKINNNSSIRARLTTGSEKNLNLTTSKLPDLF